MINLIQILTRLLGNKRYLSDLEKILNKLDLTPHERQTMQYLCQDLAQLEIQLNKKKRF